jgi:hypothetical protein
MPGGDACFGSVSSRRTQESRSFYNVCLTHGRRRFPVGRKAVALGVVWMGSSYEVPYRRSNRGGNLGIGVYLRRHL